MTHHPTVRSDAQHITQAVTSAAQEVQLRTMVAYRLRSRCSCVCMRAATLHDRMRSAPASAPLSMPKKPKIQRSPRLLADRSVKMKLAAASTDSVQLRGLVEGWLEKCFTSHLSPANGGTAPSGSKSAAGNTQAQTSLGVAPTQRTWHLNLVTLRTVAQKADNRLLVAETAAEMLVLAAKPNGYTATMRDFMSVDNFKALVEQRLFKASAKDVTSKRTPTPAAILAASKARRTARKKRVGQGECMRQSVHAFAHEPHV